MKNLLLILFFFSAGSLAQEKLVTKSGTVSFEASVTSFEEVAARNNSITAIVNAQTGEIAALALVKGFRFKNALMEEHFNENYAESNKYPKATFKGKIEDFDYNTLPSGKNDYFLNGELQFKGRTVQLNNIRITLSKSEMGIMMSGDFKVQVSSFHIKIPSVVEDKINEEVKVEFSFEFN